MDKETIKRLVESLYNNLSTLSSGNPSYYANIYAEKYNAILKELKTLYKEESFIMGMKELPLVLDDSKEVSKELARLFQNVNVSVSQLKAFLIN